MAGKTLKVTIAQDTLDRIFGALKKNGEAKIDDADIESILTVAVKGWVEALLGPERPKSTTELYLWWLKEIYSSYLTAEDPSESRLFGAMGFPYGQAAYMVRVLREYQLPNTRRRALLGLEQALSIRLTEAKEWIKNKRGQEQMKFTISKNSRRELELVLGALVASGREARPIRTEGTMGDYAVVLIQARDIEILSTEVGKLLAQIK